MTLYKNKYRIESARLKDWDYSTSGGYFITICVKNMINVLGKIINEKVILSDAGKIVEEEWLRSSEVRENVMVDEYVIMPNHVHGIIFLFNDISVETSRWDVCEKNKNLKTNSRNPNETLQRSVSTGMKPDSLSSMINQFKSKCTKRIRSLGYPDFAWQSRFYDHVIRTEKGLNNISDYIRMNRAKWDKDEYYKR